jgi:hypothetical protein
MLATRIVTALEHRVTLDDGQRAVGHYPDAEESSDLHQQRC